VHAFAFEATITGWLTLALLVVKLWALVDAVLRPAQAYVAADKLTKAAWLWILGLAFVADLVLPNMLLLLAGTIAAFVYLLDVRPAVASVTRRR
jgi:Protein of unknown function (DUF2516)